ncbi:D-beta-hydroxybutyrate dehydrogenase, mitochondrial-like [Panulirus ornatus]|uniref:D-beta-hydroxybutyrate dehydrogenase, mitochondrial-like n=1 Tax=Panulirus ornatus TaxID=150431 RepID=UPI003A83745A
MQHSFNKVARVIFWGCVSCVLAALLSLLGLANFWMAFWGAWLLSASCFLLLASFTVPATGRAVLVTGCDSGIGHALALHLDRLGFRVFAGCLLAEERAEGADRLRRMGSHRLHVLQLDVCKQEQLDFALRTIRLTLADGEVLWALVNNAGISTYGAVEWVPMTTYRKLLDVNVLGAIATTKTFLPLLRKAKGRVVNITSVEGRFATPLFSTYQLTKHALECFSDCLRNEIKRFGVHVSIVEPGNFTAGTELNTDEATKLYSQDMWIAMDEEVRAAYGANYFDHVVNTKLHNNKTGMADLSPVMEVLTQALTQKFPQCRYVCASLSMIIMTFVAEHFPEWVFDWIYVDTEYLT